MHSSFQPPFGFGAGSQPVEGDELSYMPSPGQMRTFEAHIPELSDREAERPALDLLLKVADACAAAAKEPATTSGLSGVQFETQDLPGPVRKLLDETLGQGEVVCQLSGDTVIEATESVFAGVWRVIGDGKERIEVADIPTVMRELSFEALTPALGTLAPKGPGIFNAPALITELLDKSRHYTPGDEPHVVNLSLLPHTPEDLNCLELALGTGRGSILSRGYGECRIEATGLPSVWRVRYYNSVGLSILDTFEVTDMPLPALAAREDFEDSAVRLREVVRAIR